jgi:hypothetical protein
MALPGALRIFRAGVVTGCIFSLAAAGHLFAGGVLPAPVIVAAMLLVLLVPVTWLAGRQLSFGALLAVLGTGNVLLHAGFEAQSVPGICEPRAPAHSGHAQAVHCLPHPAAGPAAAQPFAADALAVDAGVVMLAAHLAAVVLTAGAIRRGEAALWQLLAWLRPLIRQLRPALVVADTCGSRPDTAFTLLARPWPNMRVDCRRGPPGPGAPAARPA